MCVLYACLASPRLVLQGRERGAMSHHSCFCFWRCFPHLMRLAPLSQKLTWSRRRATVEVAILFHRFLTDGWRSLTQSSRNVVDRFFFFAPFAVVYLLWGGHGIDCSSGEGVISPPSPDISVSFWENFLQKRSQNDPIARQTHAAHATTGVTRVSSEMVRFWMTGILN